MLAYASRRTCVSGSSRMRDAAMSIWFSGACRQVLLRPNLTPSFSHAPRWTHGAGSAPPSVGQPGHSHPNRPRRRTPLAAQRLSERARCRRRSTALSRLARDGTLQRLSKGVYYRARPTALGPSRPDPVCQISARWLDCRRRIDGTPRRRADLRLASIRIVGGDCASRRLDRTSTLGVPLRA